jgi:hypothetical protein
LVSFRITAKTTQAQSFVEIDTEHGISDFEALDGEEINLGLVAPKRNAPVLRHRIVLQRDRAGRHRNLRSKRKYSKFQKVDEQELTKKIEKISRGDDSQNGMEIVEFAHIFG